MTRNHASDSLDRHEVAMELLREALRDGRTASLQVTGGSMAPLICDGDRVEVAFRPLAVGAIAVFRLGHAECICHRVLTVDGDAICLAGDRANVLERTALESVVGRVVRVTRGNRTVEPGCGLGGIAGRLLAHLHHLEIGSRGSRIAAGRFVGRVIGVFRRNLLRLEAHRLWSQSV